MSVSMLISEEAIRDKVTELAALINRDFEGKEITLLCALTGAMIFSADLARKLDGAVYLDFVGVSSYGAGHVGGGRITVNKEPNNDLKDKHVLLVEDIIDTGHTLSFLRDYLASQNVASLKVCALLDKPDRREVDAEADYTGFTIPDHFVVGYGLDYAQRYRNLPFVGKLNF